jgi:hypothetical protein
VAGGYGEREHGPSGDDPKEEAEAEAEAVVVVVGMVGSWEVEVGFSLPLCSCTAMGQWREGGRRVVESRGEGRGGEKESLQGMGILAQALGSVLTPSS